MANPKPLRLADIYEAGGGTMTIAVDLGISQSAVRLWRRQGIPLRHWAQLRDRYGVSLGCIHRIDERIRRDRRKKIGR